MVVSNADPLYRFAFGAVFMLIVGLAVQNMNGLTGAFGLYMLGSKKGIHFITKAANKSPRFWRFFADWGLAMSFGIVGYLIFRKRIDKRAFALGLASLILALLFLLPNLGLLFQFLNIPQITSRLATSAQVSMASAGASWLYYVTAALSILGGLSLLLIIPLAYSGALILSAVFSFLPTAFTAHPNYTALNQQVPGVAPVLPGITVPLFSALIALLILLVVHEFSHGIQAVLSRVKIKSIGIVLFGILPFGAYVEPDETQIKKLGKDDQDRISIAGVSANMLFSFVFFMLTFVTIVYVLPGISTDGVLVTHVFNNTPAFGVIANGSVITEWNNISIINEYSLANAESHFVYNLSGFSNAVRLTTRNNTYYITPEPDGKLGISVSPAAYTLQYNIWNFLYAVFVLSFTLNFLVAIVNLIPLPGFDGWRVYQNRIKNKLLLKIIVAAVLLIFIANMLPWLWIQ